MTKATSLFDLSGRVALITGGNGGIGLAMATGLAKSGASVIIAGRNAAKGALAVQRLADTGAKTRFEELDVTDPAACRHVIGEVGQSSGRLDILINNAGTTVRKRPEELSLDEWESILKTNLTSAFTCSQAAYPFMKAAKAGKIITIGSMLSIFGVPFGAAYGASKGGIVQLTRQLASAWASDNIQVNAILPGWIETDLTASAKLEVAGLEERVAARTPAGRWGRVDDFQGIAMFLASSASDFITGTAIPVDGGYSIAG